MGYRGTRKFSIYNKNYLRNSDGVFFVFDLSNEESFFDLEKWYELYKNEKGDKINGVILGNKSDLVRKVNYEDVDKYAKEKNLKYFETSAKLDKSIKKAIVSLLEVIIKSRIHYNKLSPNDCLESENVISFDEPNKENNEIFQLEPQTFEEESCLDQFCKSINPRNWFV